MREESHYSEIDWEAEEAKFRDRFAVIFGELAIFFRRPAWPPDGPTRPPALKQRCRKLWKAFRSRLRHLSPNGAPVIDDWSDDLGE